MQDRQGLQRISDVTMGDLGRGLARYRSPLALVVAVALMALILPGHKGSSVGAGGSANGNGVRGAASATSAGTDTAASADTSGGVTASASLAPGSTKAGATSKAAATSAGTNPASTTDPACDPATGRIRYPSLYAPPCAPPYDGNNGGSTYQGVSGSEITICDAQAASTPQGQAIGAALGDTDTPEQVQKTTDDYIQLFQHHYQTWGRTVKLVRYDESGTDEGAGKSDAIKCAKDIKGFMALDTENTAYTEEIVANKLLCFCTVTMSKDYYLQRAPYVWGTGLEDYDQEFSLVTEMLAKQINGQKAKYAGDATFQLKDRAFGFVHYDTADNAYAGAATRFMGDLKKNGVNLIDEASYVFDLNTAQQDSQTIMAKFKNDGVTSVIFAGDPVYPEFFTSAATKQNYFPEWVITGTALTDTAFFARIYDKEQWGHAFGLGLLAARGPNNQAEYARAYQAEYGTAPPATSAAPVIYAELQQIFTGIMMAGPKLTPETYRDGLFRFPVSPPKPGITVPTLSWGKQLWNYDDYNAYDDGTEIFWDPTAQGPDETGHNGVGMYRYVHMGKRYLPGDFKNEPFQAFGDSNDNVTIYDQLPPQDQPPKYDWKQWYCPPKPRC
jgi:hypothetical protein